MGICVNFHKIVVKNFHTEFKHIGLLCDFHSWILELVLIKLTLFSVIRKTVSMD